MAKVSSYRFYQEYHGHLVEHLREILPHLRNSNKEIIWTAGDSSLDNKYWFEDRADAIGPYASVLEPPTMKQDVTYWLNALSNNRVAINTAVEATTLNERTFALRQQDVFLRDHLGANDTLIVSIGGNDIALLPSPCTILSMCGLLCLPQPCIDHACTCKPLPCDDYCWGCGPSLLSCACACPPCGGYFHHLFGTRVQNYIEKLVSKTKPRRVLVCMIYYLDERSEAGWAEGPLKAMGYNRNPAKLQSLIRRVFLNATSNIQIPGTQVIPVPLFRALDGKQTQDYVQRVEPSSQGGRKMAEYLLHVIDNTNNSQSSIYYGSTMSAAPTKNVIVREEG